MDEWVQEFRQSLAEIDKGAKAQAQAMSLGAVKLKVSNGDKCRNRWERSVDDGAHSVRKGKTAAVRGLVAGQHKVRVTGTIADKELQAEAAFSAAGVGPRTFH